MRLKTALIFCFLMVFSTVAFANSDVWQHLSSEKNSAGNTLWNMYFNKESVYKNEDGTVTFWAKYIPYDKTIKEDYKKGLLRHAKDTTGKDPVIKDNIYCLYQITVNFEENVYKMSKHYWYNDDKEQSFITGYDAQERWTPVSEDFVKNFDTVKNYIINK